MVEHWSMGTYKLWAGGYIGDYIVPTIEVIKGDTRSLDYSS